MTETPEHAEAVAAARQVLHAYMAAFNAVDGVALAKVYHFPSAYLASNRFSMIDDVTHEIEAIAAFREKGWHHSAWDRLTVIHASPLKVHLDARINRYRADNTIFATATTLIIVTNENGHWAIRLRSNFL